jgi:hypothetical protein
MLHTVTASRYVCNEVEQGYDQLLWYLTPCRLVNSCPSTHCKVQQDLSLLQHLGKNFRTYTRSLTE